MTVYRRNYCESFSIFYNTAIIFFEFFINYSISPDSSDIYRKSQFLFIIERGFLEIDYETVIHPIII